MAKVLYEKARIGLRFENHYSLAWTMDQDTNLNDAD
jgi:hypothetical protein